MSNKAFQLSISRDDVFTKKTFVKHNSETHEHFVSKLIVFCLNYSPELIFNQEICRGMLPDLYKGKRESIIQEWFEIGNFTKKKIEFASRHSKKVTLYIYKNIPQVKRYIEKYDIEVFYLKTDYQKIWEQIQKNHKQWKLISSPEGIFLNEFNVQVTKI